jgi:hypothetical protein
MLGEARPPIGDWESVTFTFQMPEGAERIAHLKAKSTEGFWPAGEPAGYEFTRLKKEAAKLGANVVVILDATTEIGTTAVPLYDGGTAPAGYMMLDRDVDVIEGTAVYVEK